MTFSASPLRRRGFTLVELLVVMVILSMLVGMLIPAVQMAREAGRKATCANNLKQVGIALTHYETTNRKFPYGNLRHGNIAGQNAEKYGHSWWVRILPFLEEGNIMENYDWLNTMGGELPNNQKNFALLRGMEISVMACPSSPMPAMIRVDGIGSQPAGLVQRAHYAGIAGSIADVNVVTSTANPLVIKSFDGMLTDCIQGKTGFFTGVTPGDHRGGFQVTRGHVKDGLSSTMIVAEQSGWCFNGVDFVDCSVRGGRNADPEHSRGTFVNGECCSHWMGIGDSNITVRHPIGFRSSLGVGATGPNTPIQSAHPQGANVLMAGGSVHFLIEGTDIEILYALANRDDGMNVDVGGL